MASTLSVTIEYLNLNPVSLVDHTSPSILSMKNSPALFTRSMLWEYTSRARANDVRLSCGRVGCGEAGQAHARDVGKGLGATASGAAAGEVRDDISVPMELGPHHH